MRRAQAALRRGVQPPRLAGPMAGRTFHSLRLPAHMETTAQIAGIYPFVVDVGLNAPGMYIGRHVWSGNSFVFDVFELYRKQVIENPNFAVFGAVGSRKSSLLKTLISRGSAFGYQAAVPCDPKGEYTRLARRLGCEPTYIGPGLTTRLNPLDAPPRPRGISDQDWTRELKRARSALLASLIETAKGVPLTPAEHTAVDLALDVVTRQITGASADRQATPLLPHVLEAMTDPSEQDCAHLPMTATELRDASRDATLTLRRLTHGALAGLFDGPTTSPLDFDRPIAVLNLERVQGSDEMIALIMTCAQAWMEAALMRQDGVQRYVVYDECWRLMRFAGLVRRLSAQQKLARQWGCANALVAHRISDLLSASPDSVEVAKGLLAETAIRILYKQSSDQIAATKEALDLTNVAADLLPRLDPGYALWLIGERAFYVEHVVASMEIPVVLNGSKMHGQVDDTNLSEDDLDPAELDPPGVAPHDFAEGTFTDPADGYAGALEPAAPAADSGDANSASGDFAAATASGDANSASGDFAAATASGDPYSDYSDSGSGSGDSAAEFAEPGYDHHPAALAGYGADGVAVAHVTGPATFDGYGPGDAGWSGPSWDTSEAIHPTDIPRPYEPYEPYETSPAVLPDVDGMAIPPAPRLGEGMSSQEEPGTPLGDPLADPYTDPLGVQDAGGGGWTGIEVTEFGQGVSDPHSPPPRPHPYPHPYFDRQQANEQAGHPEY
jgi:hypothetical protein